MPAICIDHVVSCSSADKSNPAENLLKSDGTHKWKCATVGEKKISVVLQFNKSSEIKSIDIGNEGSAFVEVLVGKATAAADNDFEVLLVASSFMSPIESRDGTNRNSVRMFGPEKLNKQVADKKWDRVKIVCTQPFSKLLAFGLSFIKFHSLSSGDSGEGSTKKLGAFTIKDSNDDDDDDIRIGSLFASRSKIESPATPKGAAAIRAATKLAEEKIRSTSTAPLPPSSSSNTSNERKRPSSPSLNYENNLKTKAAKTSKDDREDEDQARGSSSDKLPLKKQSTSLSSVASSTHSRASRDDKTPIKKTKTEPTRSSPNVKFSKLMEKVVFVLSGFQNPYRGELRDKALEMGANYKPDWGRDCTHLICAFDNTPKYQQVKGKGKIVTKKWILECHKQRKLLPWRKYRLGDAESPDESSTDEEEEYKPPTKAAARPSSPPVKADDKPSSSSKSTVRKGIQYTADSDSGGDTEDELRKADERAKLGTKKASPVSQAKKKKDPYNDSTDEDDTQEASTLPIPSDGDDSDSGLPDLPDFFSDKHFFFYGDFPDGQQRLLTRYIAAYNGEVEDYMSSKLNFVITSQKWDDNFEVALNDNPGIIFVKPKWIVACHEKGSLTPYQPHIVVPS